MSVRAVQKTESDAIIERLLALDDAQSRAQLVVQHPTVAWDEIVNTLTEKVWQEVRIDTHRAKCLAEAALDVAQALASPSLLARSLRAKANAMWFMGECRSAVDLFERAAALFEQAGKMDEVGRTLSRIATSAYSGSRSWFCPASGFPSAVALPVRAKAVQPPSQICAASALAWQSIASSNEIPAPSARPETSGTNFWLRAST